MKAIVIFACLFAVALALPANVEIVKQSSQVDPHSYAYNVETSDGSQHTEEGHLVNEGSEIEAIVVKGAFSFVADDGNTYSVNYIADENGFQPKGAHLPTGPV